MLDSTNVNKHPLANCSVCPYLTIGQYVPSSQAPNGKAKVMVLGEAPGPQEAKTGIPFTGPSGNLLNKVLKHHGINASEVIKTNTTLCRPFGPTEKPPKAAIEACSERLYTEIAESGVQHIIALGNTAAHAVLNERRTITSLRVGPPKTYKYDKSVKVIPTVHPAFCLRSPDNFPDFVADIGKIHSTAYEGWTEPIYRVFDDPDIALQAIALLKKRTTEVVLDIEVGVEKDIDFVQPEEYQMLCIGLCYEAKKAVVFGEEALKDSRVIVALKDYLNGVNIIGQNCFSGDTEIITKDGVKQLGQLNGDVEVWTKQGWKSGIARNYGKAELYELTLVPARYRSNIEHKIKTTGNHRWPLINGELVETKNLQIDDKIQSERVEVIPSETSEAFIHGLMFADGSLTSKQPKHKKHILHQMRLCGWKKKYVHLFSSVSYYPAHNGEPVVYYSPKINMKELPQENADFQYIADFIHGWQLFDGTDFGKNRDVRNKDLRNWLWLKKHATIGGWFNTGGSVHMIPPDQGYNQKWSRTTSVILSKGNNKKPIEWRVKEVKQLNIIEDVYCVEVPEIERFTLASGVYTANCKFDLRGLSPLLGILKIYFDTMLASHALDERPGKHGLKDMAVEILGAPRYDDAIKQYIPNGGSYANIPREILYKYNAYDVVCTWDLYQIFKAKMSPELRAAHDFKVSGANTLIHLELAGMPYDTDYAIDLAQEYEIEIEELETKIATVLGFTLNPRSPMQVKNFLETQGIKMKSTDADHMKELQKKLFRNNNVDSKANKFVDLLMEHRGVTKLYGTYVKGLLKRVNKEKIYTTYTLHGTTSGRLASRSPNMQNIAKINKIRNQFTVEHDDNLLIQLDYKQAELRAISTLAQDEYLRDILADPNRDLFTELTKQIYGNKEVYDARRKIKSVVYGLCVPLNTKILTRRGWLSYDQVIPNVDETIGYDASLGKSRWTKIKNVFTYKNKDVMKISNGTTTFEATPNHRWLAEKSTRVWANGKQSKRKYIEEFVETKDINTEHKLQLAKKFESDSKLNIIDQEAAILGWAMSDGYIKISERTNITSQGSQGQRQSVKVQICQDVKNVKNIKEIDRVLKNYPHTKDLPTPAGQIWWRISQPAGRELLRNANLLTVSGNYKETDPIQFAFSMSDSQRFAFIRSVYLGDGMVGQPIICQNAGWLSEVIKIVGYLEGYVVRSSTNNHSKLSDNVQYRHRFGKAHITGQKISKESVGEKDVWCVETELGTWTMQQDGLTVLTGNSYGREAESIARELNITISEAVELLANFRALIPKTMAWQNAVTHKVLNGKDLVTPFGRKRSFYLITNENRRDVVNEALSYLPQSIASDICLSALIHVHPMLQGVATMRLTVHDALIFEAHKSKVDEAIEIVKREMVASGLRFTDYVPFPVDVSMGKRLGEL